MRRISRASGDEPSHFTFRFHFVQYFPRERG